MTHVANANRLVSRIDSTLGHGHNRVYSATRVITKAAPVDANIVVHVLTAKNNKKCTLILNFNLITIFYVNMLINSIGIITIATITYVCTLFNTSLRMTVI